MNPAASPFVPTAAECWRRIQSCLRLSFRRMRVVPGWSPENATLALSLRFCMLQLCHWAVRVCDKHEAIRRGCRARPRLFEGITRGTRREADEHADVMSCKVTINNGRRRIGQLAASLRLGQVGYMYSVDHHADLTYATMQHYIDSAHRLFLLAVQRNFVQVQR